MKKINQTKIKPKFKDSELQESSLQESEFQPAEKKDTSKVTMYHDGDCPLCKFEIAAMQKLDTKKAIRWVDITQEKEALTEAGITYQQAMARIHVKDKNQNMVSGVRGFLAVWEHLPYYRRVVPIIRNVPFLLTIMEAVYVVFAKYRLPMTGKKQLKAKIK